MPQKALVKSGSITSPSLRQPPGLQIYSRPIQLLVILRYIASSSTYEMPSAQPIPIMPNQIASRQYKLAPNAGVPIGAARFILFQINALYYPRGIVQGVVTIVLVVSIGSKSFNGTCEPSVLQIYQDHQRQFLNQVEGLVIQGSSNIELRQYRALARGALVGPYLRQYRPIPYYTILLSILPIVFTTIARGQVAYASILQDTPLLLSFLLYREYSI